jgi:hypothetical protein
LGLRQYREAAAESWLEYSFGWRPWLNDISDGLAAFRGLANSEQYLKFSASSVKQMKDPMKSKTASGWQFVTLQSRHARSTDYLVRYRGEVRLGVHGLSAPRSFGLLPGELIPAAWELLPWSFLIDYFVNIGDVLDSVVTLSTSDFAWVNKTTRAKYECLTQTYCDSSYDHVSSDGSSHVVRKVVKRKALSSVPMPSLQIRNRLSTSKVLNIAALLQLRAHDRNYRRR